MKLNRKVLDHSASVLYKLFRYALLIGISYVVLFPIIKMISSAFTPPQELYTEDSGFLPSRATFVNFKEFQSYFPYLKYSVTTAEIALISTFLQLISCSLVGYGLGRYKFKGNALVYACVLSPLSCLCRRQLSRCSMSTVGLISSASVRSLACSPARLLPLTC